MAKLMPNVALIGSMRSGKSSIADCLRATLGAEQMVINLSFARALKQEVAELLNGTRQPTQEPFTAEFFDRDANRPLYRPLLQWYGTEYRRGQKANYWVEKVEQVIQSYDGILSFTCTDARFLNELEMLKKNNFRIVLLDLDQAELYDYLSDKGMSREQISRQLSHPSENEWRNFKPDFVVQSRFGNLPRITREIASYLTGEDQGAAVYDEYYKQRYPAIYK